MPSHVRGRAIEAEEAHGLLTEARLVNVHEHPACVDFELPDGRVLALYEGDGDHSREWVIEGEDA